MLSGSETSIIWTILSTSPVTATYVLEFMVNEVIPKGLSRSNISLSARESVADMLAGSETSIIWIPLSRSAVTAIYALEFMVNEVIP